MDAPWLEESLVPAALSGPLFGPTTPGGVLMCTVTLPETQVTRPAPFAASDGDTNADSLMLSMCTPGPSMWPLASGTYTSAFAAPGDSTPSAVIITAATPATWRNRIARMQVPSPP